MNPARHAAQRTISIAVLLVLSGWLALTVLVACPFLTAEPQASAAHPCCPREAPTPRCPVSPSLRNCPFYATESKLGIVQQVQADKLVVPAAPIEIAAQSASEYRPTLAIWQPAGVQLLHRLHILRI